MSKRALPKAVQYKRFIPNDMRIEGGTIVIDFGLHLPSRSNLTHTHWRLQAKIAKEHRLLGAGLVHAALQEHSEALGWPPVTKDDKWLVHMTRIAIRPLDSDNMVSSFKSIRDGAADSLGNNDKWLGNIKWDYDQERNKEYGIRIVLTRLSEG